MLRKKYKNLAIIIIFSFIISIIASILFLTHSLKKEAFLLFQDAPDIVVQRLLGGRHDLIPVSYIDTIKSIAGVGEVKPRFWGYYFDPLTDCNYTLMGIDNDTNKKLEMLQGHLPKNSGECAAGLGVSETRLSSLGDEIFLSLSKDSKLNLKVTGLFEADSSLLTNDLIIIKKEDFTQFFSVDDGKATDLTVEVYNKSEIKTVAAKIQLLLPDTRPIQKAELIRTYDSLFNWRSGMILTMFMGALLAFAIFAWDKATGLSASERQEIGILKAIGWETSDVLELKFWEGFAISVLSFLTGLILSYIHVFLFGATFFAPVLKGWSVLFPEFEIIPFISVYHVFVIFFLTIVPYVASTIIPSWKAAITDPDVVMRS